MSDKSIYISEIIHWMEEKGIDYELVGESDGIIDGFSSLLNYRTGTITWIKKSINPQDLSSYVTKEVSCAVVERGKNYDLPHMICVDNSKEKFFAILHEFWGQRIPEGIGEGSVVSEGVILADTVSIGMNCSLVGDIVVGDNTVIEHNVVIQGRVSIGANCHIQSGTVIGIDGFGYSQDTKTKKKTMIEHFGGVCIGDDVFIGSHVNIARGTIDDTIIADGVKIAPSTHIGHNNVIGTDAAVICSNLFGSVRIGDRAYITASTVSNQTQVGDDTVIGMGSVVTKSIESNSIAFGSPAVIKRTNDSDL